MPSSLQRYLNLLTGYLAPQWPRVLLLALLLAAGTVLQVYTPQLVRRFLDTAMDPAITGSLPLLAALFIAVALAGQVVTALARYTGEQVSWTATNRLRRDLTGHCLKLDLGFHKERTPGEMVERIDGDVSVLASFFSTIAIDLVGSLLLLVGVLVAVSLEDWRAGLAMALFAAVTLFALVRVRAWAAPYQAKARQAWAEFYGFLGEKLGGLESIRASGAEGYVLHRFHQRFRTTALTTFRSSLAWATTWGATLSILAVGDAITLGLAAYLYLKGSITLGTVYLFYHYIQLLNRPLEKLRTQMQEMQKVGASVDRVAELTATAPRIIDGETGAPLPPGSLGVAFRQVSFAYEGADSVLRQVSFELEPGSVLGLLGRTGSGKSTLARLLLRFYDPAEGEVLLGGTVLTRTRLRDLRSRVGFVTQDVQLFAATVRENLTFFDPAISDERITAILQELGLGPWLRSLPRGLDTPLGAGGSSLSAGEAQLLALGRVFLADPGLVILDEPSSRLDPATEALVERAVARLLAGRTGIIIAHRLATVQRADRILILEDGVVAEEGERRALEHDPSSRFARLLQTGLGEVLA